MTTLSTHTLQVPGAALAYDVRGPLPTTGRPPLLMVGQPMDASGFATLAGHFPDRTVVTYDPRGLGRSTRDDGRLDHDPAVQAEDLHALVEALGAGPVEVFASSGGAVTALALVAAHPGDVVDPAAGEEVDHPPREGRLGGHGGLVVLVGLFLLVALECIACCPASRTR